MTSTTPAPESTDASKQRLLTIGTVRERLREEDVQKLTDLLTDMAPPPADDETEDDAASPDEARG